MKPAPVVSASVVTMVLFCLICAAVILAIRAVERREHDILAIAPARFHVNRSFLEQRLALARLARGDAGAIEAYDASSARFARAVAAYATAVKGLGSPQAIAAVQNESAVHAAWVREVAAPTIAGPTHRSRLRGPPDRRLMARFRADDDRLIAFFGVAGSRVAELERLLSSGLVAGSIVLTLALATLLYANAKRQKLLADEAARNVVLYHREHEIANVLQRAVLAHELPPLDGLAVSARYRPADEPHRLGGDWYDVLPSPTVSFSSWSATSSGTA